MLKYAVIGHPVGHSRSPGMHNAAFSACRIDARYLKFEVAPEEFSEFIKFASRELSGFNLTVPHKQIILPYLDEIEPDAERIGSVNTVKFLPDGKLSGCSTDGIGFEEAVRFRLGMEISGSSALLLGCGGAARAVAFQLKKRGASRIVIANRSYEKAAMLASELGGDIEVLELSDDAGLRRVISDTDLLIQATSLGLHAGDPPPIDLEVLFAAPESLSVMDLIYLPTPLLKEAGKFGFNCCDGREMLLRQGAASFRFWTGVDAPVEEMRHGMETERTDLPLDKWRS